MKNRLKSSVNTQEVEALRQRLKREGWEGLPKGFAPSGCNAMIMKPVEGANA